MLALMYSRELFPGTIEVMGVLTARGWSFGLPSLGGRIGQIAKAFDKGAQVVGIVSGDVSPTLPGQGLGVPFRLRHGTVLPHWSWVSSPTETPEDVTLDDDYYVVFGSAKNFVLPQITASWTSIGVQLAFVVAWTYTKNSVFDYELPSEQLYEAPLDMSKGMKVYLPKLSTYSGMGLVIASTTDFYTYPMSSYIDGFEWIWGGQELPYYHIAIDMFDEVEYDDRGFLRLSKTYEPGALRTIGVHSDFASSFVEHVHSTTTINGHSITTDREDSAGVLWFPSVPAIIVPPPPKPVSCKVGGLPTIVSVLGFLGVFGVVLSHNPYARWLTLDGDGITLNDERILL